MVLRYIYGGRLSLEEYDTSDIIKILHDTVKMNTIQVWEHVLKWGIAQNPELSSGHSSYSKDDFITLKNTLQQCIPFINFFNLTSKEYLDKVYPYKKIIPKDLREKLFRHFMDQLNNNLGLNITKEIDSKTISSVQKNISIEKDFNMIVDEINDFIYKLVNNEEFNLVKQKVGEYLNDHNINTHEFYNWLVNNQISTSSIFLFGCFNYYGIITSENSEKVFNLFINASEKNHALAQYFVGECYEYGYGTIKNEKLAFEYYEKAANNTYAIAQLNIGYRYRNGVGVEEDFKKAFYWYDKAANNGNITAMYNLGNCYRDGIGTKKDHNKAFELYQQSAERGYSSGIMTLGYCYSYGIGTKIDKQKAFGLYQDAANLGEEFAQYNLALMYENGEGVTKDMDKAIYWYNKSANQGYEDAKNNLERLQTNNLR
ncbi:kinase-like domain-containing protein [Rhizophagus clarus]|uniref:Kinase-like domain-containing protein n=1 Tax=Rhizophagus clarus TaxID=94130 RepID=A0A8H3R813_9GLOM|nr:kinase-like domain-containing protein [Rhizophagus clarus]